MHSFSETLNLTCGQCGHALALELWLIVDAGERPDLLARAGALHAVICPNCGPQGEIDAPLLLYLPDHNPATGQPPLIFSPAQQTSAEQDQQMAAGLLRELAGRLGNAWQDDWLARMTTVQRPLLPAALSDDPEAAMRQTQTEMEAALADLCERDPDAYRQLAAARLAAEADDDDEQEEADEVASLACIARQALATRRAWHDLGPPDARLESVLALLRGGGYDWLHFATHGELDDGELAVSITLEDGRLQAASLYGPGIRGHVAGARPGVMLNICHGARLMWSLTHLGGWAQWFLSAGAGLFVAPLWTVTDEHAHLFARTFYARLTAAPVNGIAPTVSTAVAAARAAAQGDGDPTWLAYSVYAHPNATLAVGGTSA